ncbi:TetR/AcrR family transcriptional regulator [Plantibacter sp. Mn2098]|uniref:TetR/AcrR family transcriptional regulator n=1 Tax=Plantibacter sp. Mn2098 TaxID=3395266 RepID=UPI003BD5ECB3
MDETNERPGASAEGWAAKVAAWEAAQTPKPRKQPITRERILDAAFELIGSEGFDALTMRRVAAALQTGAASLYVHVRNKAELDDLLIGAISARVRVPQPDGARWVEQFTDVCQQLRDAYLRYPGVARAALSASPNNLDAMQLSEGMLSILLAGGIAPGIAAWGIDAATLYVAAYSLEASLRRDPATGVDERVIDRDATIARFRMLPADRFPATVEYAEELASGDDMERFDFALDLLLQGLAPNTDHRGPDGTASERSTR